MRFQFIHIMCFPPVFLLLMATEPPMKTPEGPEISPNPSEDFLEDYGGDGETIFPIFFDSRMSWRRCRFIIGAVKNQGRCRSAWAIQAAAVMSDRICIESDGMKRIHFSGEDILTCCGPDCLRNENDICAGGKPKKAIEFIRKSGLVSEDCKPYSPDLRLYKKEMPCLKRCKNATFPTSYNRDKSYARFWTTIRRNSTLIQEEIMRFGSVVSYMDIREEFVDYKSGVYACRHKSPVIYKAAVKIIGWGYKDGMTYWQCVNSWGTTWGEEGFFKIKKGTNRCKIENFVLGIRTYIDKDHARGAMISNDLNGGEVWDPFTRRYLCLILILISAVR